MTGQVKQMWVEEGMGKTQRTDIIEAWAFKGRIYCNVWTKTKPRVKVMYRLITQYLDHDRAEKLAVKVDMLGLVNLALWEKVDRSPKQIFDAVPVIPSREQLVAEGKRTGICQVCNRKLTNPDSVAAGIGPICSGRV